MRIRTLIGMTIMGVASAPPKSVGITTNWMTVSGNVPIRQRNARKGLYALWITILCVLDNKDVYMWQEKVYDPKT